MNRCPWIVLFALVTACGSEGGDSRGSDSLTDAGPTTFTGSSAGPATESDTDQETSGSEGMSQTESSGSMTTDDSDSTDATSDPTEEPTTDATTDATTDPTEEPTTDDPTTDPTDDPSDTDATTEDVTVTDSDSSSSTGMDQCLQCSVTLDSTQSSSMMAINGNTFLGEAYLEDQVIYALDDVGQGRVIYTADTNILYKEISDCPLWEWLGDTGDNLPNVLSFGRYLCNGLGNNLEAYPSLTYAGEQLPAQYVGNAALLHQDYDALIYCTLANLSPAEAATVKDFVEQEGGGLYLASEYWGFINQGDLDAINSIATDFGVEFLPTNLDWGQADGNIDFDCFPIPM